MGVRVRTTRRELSNDFVGLRVTLNRFDGIEIFFVSFLDAELVRAMFR